MTINEGVVTRTRSARMRKKRMGRPSRYSRDLAKRIFKAVADGCCREAAAALAGINVATLYDWQNKIPEFPRD